MDDAEVKALLDDTTPGPWRADGEPWNRVVWSSADNRVCFMAHSNGLNDERDIATSNLAAAAPDLARALLDARAENARLRADAQVANGVWKANLRLQGELAAAQQREAGLREALVNYRSTLCEGFCGEDQWSDEGHHHPDLQRDCGGCLAASVLLKTAALSNNGRGE